MGGFLAQRIGGDMVPLPPFPTKKFASVPDVGRKFANEKKIFGYYKDHSTFWIIHHLV